MIEHMNANTMVVLQIETQRALDARRELLAVPGIDAVMVGPARAISCKQYAGADTIGRASDPQHHSTRGRRPR